MDKEGMLLEVPVNIIYSRMEIFNTSREYLTRRLFVPEPPRQGKLWTTLNITVLPDYMAYIKQQLTKEEQLLLSDYPLQTYLIEAAQKPHPHNDFDACTDVIIAHLRSSPEFWVKKNTGEQLQMHQAIEAYRKDCALLEESKMVDEYPEKQYRPPSYKKIEDDYVYVKNQPQKGSHKFTATLYPWIAEFAVQGRCSPDLQVLRQFILQMIVGLAIKSKPRVKNQYYRQLEEQAEVSERATKAVEAFSQFLQAHQVDSRSLSSHKDYYLLVNSIIIAKSFVLIHFQKHEQQSPQTSTPSPKENEIDEILVDLSSRLVKESQLNQIILFFNQSQFQVASQLKNVRQGKQNESQQPMRGFHCTAEQLQGAWQKYNEIINNPENTNRMKYKVEGSEVPWNEAQYLLFLKHFAEMFNIPTNNKKIAIAMGKNIEPNHVKHVKNIYNRNMSNRIRNGEIGGGKKGVFESKIAFLRRDIENFNMRWFKKDTKPKGKRIKRKRRRETQDGEEHDSDY